MKKRMGQKDERRKERRKVQSRKPVRVRVGGRQKRVPPPESELWPPWCRGELWNWESARFYVGRCQLCAYSCQASERRRYLDKRTGLPTFLVCTNHPESPGRMREVIPTDKCRNFKTKLWLPERVKPTRQTPEAAFESDRRVRRIPLGHNLFAIVDARDYKWLSQYKWCTSNKRGTVYAVRRTKDGRMVYMHREIMQAPKGTIVDHIDHNTLNNRRSNLRVCRPEQNYANVGPHGGESGFVGVHRCCGKWEAGITWRGFYYYCGRYDDPVEAAKVRDRKAHELHGSLAYINLPEELKRWLRQQGRKKAKTRGQSGMPRRRKDGVRASRQGGRAV